MTYFISKVYSVLIVSTNTSKRKLASHCNFGDEMTRYLKGIEKGIILNKNNENEIKFIIGKLL